MPRTKVEAETNQRGSVEWVHVPNDVRLINVGPDHPVWGGGKPKVLPAKAIVRLVPPPDCTEENLDRVKRIFASDALELIWVTPKRSSVVAEETHRTAVKVIGAREAVEELVQESTVDDRDALGDLVQKIMSEVGL